MKIKQIIKDAGEILGFPDVKEGDATYSLLFRLANLVVSNVSSNYIDCIETQTFIVENQRIEFSKFNKTFLKVKDVRLFPWLGNIDGPIDFGSKAVYELFINFLRVPNGRVRVTYACVPRFANGDDSISVAGAIGENILLYGILAEYAYISGMFDEAKIWNDKFEQLIFNAKKDGKMAEMPAGLL